MAKKEHWLSVPKLNFESCLFYFFILFIPTQLGKHFWPDWSYLLGIRSDYLSPTIYFTDVLLVLVCVFWVKKNAGLKIRDLGLKKNNGKKVVFFLNHTSLIVNLPFLSLILYSLFIILIWPGNKFLEFYGFLKLLEMVGLFFYIQQNLFVRYKLDTIALLMGIGISGEFCLSALQFFNQGSLDGIFYWLGERHYTSQTIDVAVMSIRSTLVVRPYGTFSHPNVLAGYSLLLSTFFIFLWRTQKRVFFIASYYVFFIFFMLSALTIMLSFSRLAIVVWIVATSITMLYVRLHMPNIKRKFINGRLLFALSSLLLAVFFLLNLPPRFLTLSLTDESVVQRELLLAGSTQLFLQHPIVGIGLNNFLPALATLPQFSLNYYLLQPVHNIFVLVLVETGLSGAVLFAWLFVITIRKLLTVCRKQSASSSPAVMCLIMLLEIILTGSGDHYWLTSQQGQQMLAFVLGMSWAVIRNFNS